jgi:diketogulonate reductase-like aldo/keto reductase
MSSIHRRQIGSSGEHLPVIGLGTWQSFDVGPSSAERDPLRSLLRVLIEGGGSVIDSSPMYGRSEAVVGDLVDRDKTRDKLFVATKVWTHGREKGIEQIKRSMDLLKVKQLDLITSRFFVWRPRRIASAADFCAEPDCYDRGQKKPEI